VADKGVVRRLRWVATRRRLAPDERRRELVEVGAALFAERPYDDVAMEEVAQRAGVSRALLYRYFASKRELFAAVYEHAAVRLLEDTHLERGAPLADQVAAGLDVHIDYFVANRNTVLAANRVLAGDPTIQAIIAEEMAELRRRLLATTELHGVPQETFSAIVMAWLVFVRTMSVEWLLTMSTPRQELRDVCVGALLGALEPVLSRTART
jgi:AcrR family transcriptional regulator